ncbi:putative disease resistance protein RGA3-like isoform X1 [Hibiscus syriacus]|uniref:U-box domain-containing protein n=1 Tax=Hibiscus syriacus TaxID=106335 RepID=A0A6A3CDB8_HIBSY|nr:U-box domain-containing protein 26-like [Hibiscus syriacus]KAE8725428.1 putative disease resistance protein RGA3-like isoform X1 [Hibiscus syriacus]
MEGDEMTVPHLFTCPISLDLFTDPVTLCTGQTYDRSSIKKWLAAGNLTCPVTMQKLHDPSLVPNHNLRHLIQQWSQMGHRLHPDYFAAIDPLVSLKHSLASPSSTFLEKLQALQKIRDLTDETDSFLIEMGFLPLLLKLVFEMVDPGFTQDYVNFVEQGLACVLRLLPLGELECLNILKEGSKLESFVVLFEHGNVMVKQSLCHIVGLVSSSSATWELCGMIGQNQRLLNMIICVVKQNSEISEAGIRAISALCCLESNRENLVQQGLVDGLVTYIWNSERKDRSLAATAMAMIEQVLVKEKAKEALIKNPNGVRAVVKMVFRVSEEEGSESAVDSLIKVCEGSLEAREKAIVGGALTQLLLLLQSQCSGRTKTKATTLLKLL